MALKPFPLIILLLILIGGVAASVYVFTRPPAPVAPEEPTVLSFLDCEAAGYPVMESYPRQCRTPDGRLYVEEIPAPEPTYVNASSDNIRVTTPTPASVTGKPVTVMGEARGNWYFEASFPIEIRDTAGTVLGMGIAQPVGGANWMTEDFVPFSATVTVPEEFIGEAVLTLMNDNPSGMVENARSISFPITIEY